MKTKRILIVCLLRSTLFITGIFHALIPTVSYSQSGTLDNTFGIGGIVTTALNGNDWGYAVAIQSDGKIIVTGNSNSAMALVRYNSNGTLDNTFGTGGIVTSVFGSGSNIAASVVIQSDGKIVVAGQVGIFCQPGTSRQWPASRVASPTGRRSPLKHSTRWARPRRCCEPSGYGSCECGTTAMSRGSRLTPMACSSPSTR